MHPRRPLPARRTRSGGRPGMGPDPHSRLIMLDLLDYNPDQMRKKEVNALMITLCP